MKSNIHAIRQRMEDLKKKNHALLDKCSDEGRNLTETESAQFEDNIKALQATQKQIEAAERMLDFERTQPAVDDENRSAAERAGAPVDRGSFKSLGEQLVAVYRAAQNPSQIDPRLIQASVASDGSLGNALPSEGGFLVQKDFAPEILQRTYATGEILKRCKKLPVGGNSNGMKINAIDEDSRADGSRMGGILAYWINEADALTNSRPKFRRIELNLNKLIALVYATDELLQDAAALEAWIMTNLPTELAFRTEDAIINGTGVGQPFGVLKSNAQQTIAVSGGETNHFPNAQDVLNMWTQFWHPGLMNSIASYSTENLTPPGNGGQVPSAAWFVDQSVLAGLFGLTLGSGIATILLYHPPGYMGMPGPYGQLLGIPVIPTEHNVAVGSPGDMLLADMTQYLVIDKGAPQSASSIHVRFLTDETTFRFTYRVDGQPTWKKPLTPKSGGPTLSPFITLASR